MKTSEICKECSQQSDCCFIDNGLQHRCGVVSAYKRGFEDGIGHGWHPASELPNMGEEVVTWVNHGDGAITVSRGVYVGWPEEIINKLRWCYPPKEE